MLPTRAQLQATERSRGASPVLWAPAAAEVIERMAENGTLQDRFATMTDTRVESALELLAALAAEAPAPTAARPWDEAFLGGVSLARAPGLGNGYESPGFVALLDHLVTIDVGAVSLIPMTGQPAPDRPGLQFMNQSPGDEHDLGMRVAARAVRARDLSILWKPHVYVYNGSWPGDVEMRSEADWRQWWSDYRHFILYQAVLATHSHADLFSVGTELGKTLVRESEWRQLIVSVRRIFPGPITYAGNWWGDYDRIPFADLLDVVGVDAYFSLSHDPAASDADLVRGAHDAVRQMASVAQKFGKPMLLTEVGFSARPAAWISPHEEGEFGSPAVLEDQERAYRALLGALGRPEWLAGLYPWKVYSYGVPQGPGRSPDFAFLGRPAERVFADYLRGTLKTPASSGKR